MNKSTAFLTILITASLASSSLHGGLSMESFKKCPLYTFPNWCLHKTAQENPKCTICGVAALAVIVAYNYSEDFKNFVNSFFGQKKKNKMSLRTR